MSSPGREEPQPRHLNFDSLIKRVREFFEKLPDNRRKPDYTLADVLMAGLAMFVLKDPSMLAFMRRPLDSNLRNVFGLQGIPSDTRMREILDRVNPDDLRPIFLEIFRVLQYSKVLQEYVFIQGCYLVALDGVEYFCSKKVSCPHCMQRKHQDGSISYYHQMLGAAIIHPDCPVVLPLPFEPIERHDGQDKNDCERNAGSRWLGRFRKDHPRIKVIILQDGLGSNGPNIRDLKSGDYHFIIGVKKGDHEFLFKAVFERLEQGTVVDFEEFDEQTGTRHSYLYIRGVPINETNQDLLVNYLEYIETDKDGHEQRFTWITDLVLTEEEIVLAAHAGRGRWKIENETFNTLKNQGYHFEHNYGHGEENLQRVLVTLMILAFLIDQIQKKCNKLFQAAHKRLGPMCAVWQKIRELFSSFLVQSMTEVYQAMAYGHIRPPLNNLIGQPITPAIQVIDSS